MHMRHAIQPASLPCICGTLRKASRSISRVYDSQLANAGVTVSQYSILTILKRSGGEELSRLAEKMVMDRTSLYRALAPMVRARWLVITDTKKGRAKNVSLTREGRRIHAKAAVHWEKAQTQLIEVFGPARWHELQSGIVALAALGVEMGQRSEG